jgi:hypothetical protein
MRRQFRTTDKKTQLHSRRPIVLAQSLHGFGRLFLYNWRRFPHNLMAVLVSKADELA